MLRSDPDAAAAAAEAGPSRRFGLARWPADADAGSPSRGQQTVHDVIVLGAAAACRR